MIMHEKTILYVENVTVSFDGFIALRDLNFYMNYGELRVVIGPNGETSVINGAQSFAAVEAAIQQFLE